MAISRIKTWNAGDVLTAADLNAEFNNILNNALALVSPWTGNMAAGGFRLTGLSLGTVGDPALQFTGDTNTGIYSTAADTVDVTAGGSRAASFGAQALIIAAPEDSRTATVDVAQVIRSTTSGTPAAGIGVGLQFDAESADENPSTFGRIDFAASDIGAGTEDTYMDILLRVAGSAEETKYRFQSTAAAGFQGTFTHAATADRTWTLPDQTGGIPVVVSGAGEFFQRASYDPVAAGVADQSVYRNEDSVTFAVAYTATPYIWGAGSTDNANIWSFASQVTTTGATIRHWNNTSGGDPTNLRYVVLGI